MSGCPVDEAPDLLVSAWRLIQDGAHSGPFNMGVDEALLRAAEEDGVATLRFYSWRGPWLSVGLGQPVSAGRIEACRGAGIGVLRRVTGGRAVLHGNDLTYSIAAPAASLPQGLQASYEKIGEGLLSALRSLGLDARPVLRKAETAASPAGFDCFEVPVAGEIVVAGRKLAGNAQRRTAGAVLQHGSLRLAPDPPEIARAAGQEVGAATSIREAGCLASLAEVRSALETSLAAVLGGSLAGCELDATCSRAGFARERRHDSDNPLTISTYSPGETQEGLFGGR